MPLVRTLNLNNYGMGVMGDCYNSCLKASISLRGTTEKVHEGGSLAAWQRVPRMLMGLRSVTHLGMTWLGITCLSYARISPDNQFMDSTPFRCALFLPKITTIFLMPKSTHENSTLITIHNWLFWVSKPLVDFCKSLWSQTKMLYFPFMFPSIYASRILKL